MSNFSYSFTEIFSDCVITQVRGKGPVGYIIHFRDLLNSTKTKLLKETKLPLSQDIYTDKMEC